jgi:alkylation response protein AidB-like acyl-CoA dehydrogenase
MPIFCNIPTLSIVGPTLLEFGTDEQKSRHIGAILRGDELWVQFLSEPTGGSDLAGAVTTAVRDGDLYRISGSKIWSSGAQWCDFGLLLARTDWDRPKHQGLSVFVVGADAPGVVVQPIKQVNGSTEFCQEFFDDVEVSTDDLVGRVNDGWNVASRILAQERSALGGSSPYVSGAAAGPVRSLRMNYLDLARAAGKQHDAHVRQLVGEAYAIGRVQEAMIARVSARIAAGELAPTAGSLLKLSSAVNGIRWVDIANEILGPAAVVWPVGSLTGDFGTQYLRRQAAALGGGSSEMQRNMISERLLGMPRDRGEGANLPFREVRSNRARSGPGEERQP